MAKAQLELKLPELWGTRKSFFRYINSKTHNIVSLQDEDGHVTNRIRNKAEVFNIIFASVFNIDDG